MDTPNITQAQVLALIAAVVGLVVSQGLVSNETGKQVIGIASIALPIALALGDAIIRHGRAKVAAVMMDSLPTPPVEPAPKRATKRSVAKT